MSAVVSAAGIQIACHGTRSVKLLVRALHKHDGVEDVIETTMCVTFIVMDIGKPMLSLGELWHQGIESKFGRRPCLKKAGFALPLAM